MLFEFGKVELESKVVQGSSEANFEVFEVEDESSLSEGDLDELLVTREKSVLAGTGPEPGSVPSSLLSEPETREKPGSYPFECQPDPFPVYEERMDESEKVGDVELSEESGSSIEILQPKTIRVQPSKEGQKKKRIKVLAERIDLPIVRQFQALKAKLAKQAQVLSQSKSAKPKSTPKPSRMSFRLASQSFSRTVKKPSSSKQSPPG